MKLHLRHIVAIAAVSLSGVAIGQTSTDGTRTNANDRTAGEAARDTANAVGRAASAAVTPGDQNMGRNPDNRSGGLTGTGGAVDAAGRAGNAAVTPGDQNMGRNPDNRSGGVMGGDREGTAQDATDGRRAARADRG